MTLDEAIKHAREVAERIQKDANKQKGLNHGYYVWQSVNADKYRQIEEWLKEYNIKNYTINDDLTIDVDGFVFLNKENLKEFPDYIQFGVVKSYFSCYRNQLTSLRGCPREVREYFDCSYNSLTS